MAAGRPVLGIRSPGVGDTVQDGRNGYLAAEEDLAVFTAKMLRLVMDHQQRQALAAQASQDAELYSIDRTNQMMLERYTRVIEVARNRKSNLPRWLSTED
jgi:glycosyltransferase involved in cell wall biosynthesis